MKGAKAATAGGLALLLAGALAFAAGLAATLTSPGDDDLTLAANGGSSAPGAGVGTWASFMLLGALGVLAGGLAFSMGRRAQAGPTDPRP